MSNRMLKFVKIGQQSPPKRDATNRKNDFNEIYKEFIEEDFITDLAAVDWSDVYAANDVDVATEIFTIKFRSVLNQHAPWIIFQLMKNYSPWLTEETKTMMKLRDFWKEKAKDLAVANPGVASEEQKQAWSEYKKLRNKINNKKDLKKLTAREIKYFKI